MTREDIIRMARIAGAHDNGHEVRFVEPRYLARFAALVAEAERKRMGWLPSVEHGINGIERVIAAAVEAERRACAEYDDVLRLAQAIREAGGSKFPTGASAAASGEDRHKIARAGHDSLMREIRDALRRTDPAWCAVNGVEQISDEELEELIARVEDAVEDGE
jgi:hypothetical protein